MTYPAGVITRNVSFGPAAVLETGANLGIHVSVRGSRDLVWYATGTPVRILGATANGNPGWEAVLSLPVTDQPGWQVNGDLIDVSAGGQTHYYTASVRFLLGETEVSSATIGPFALPQGDGSTVDVDELIPGDVTGGSTVSVPDSWSTAILSAQSAAASAATSAAAAAASAATTISNLDNSVSGLIAASGSSTHAAVGTQIAARRRVVYAVDYGVKADGTTDDRLAGQAAIDAALAAGKGVVWPAGTIALSSPGLDFNGTGASRPANNQWSAPAFHVGQGRLVTTFKAIGAWSAGTYVLRLKNTAGTTVAGIGVEGNGLADSGMDFEWVGGSSGNPTLAPSTGNVWRDLWVQGCSVIGLNLDQQNDATIDTICSRGAAHTGVGISLRGGGGDVNATNVYCPSGVVRIEGQNVVILGLNAFDGITLGGGSYNHVVVMGGQIFANGSTRVLIDGTSPTGSNANRGFRFSGVQMTGASGDTLIRGRFWQGGVFQECLVLGATIGTINAAAGTGQLPTFLFDDCSFEDIAVPVTIPSQVIVKTRGCRNLGGGNTIHQFIDGNDLTSNLVYNGGTFTVDGNYLYAKSNVSGVGPAAGAGHALGWNYTGGSAEADFFNTYIGGGGFSFYQSTAGAPTHLLDVLNDGRLSARGRVEAPGILLLQKDSATTGPLELFTDVADNKLKFRDAGNVVRSVLEPLVFSHAFTPGSNGEFFDTTYNGNVKIFTITLSVYGPCQVIKQYVATVVSNHIETLALTAMGSDLYNYNPSSIPIPTLTTNGAAVVRVVGGNYTSVTAPTVSVSITEIGAGQ